MRKAHTRTHLSPRRCRDAKFIAGYVIKDLQDFAAAGGMVLMATPRC